MTEETYNRSRQAILSYVLNFNTKLYYEGGGLGGSVKSDEGFHGGYCANKPPAIGSLCVLQSAPDSRWYMSWLMETRNGGLGTEYLMKSIEDGSLCWWSNVSVKWLPKANEFPNWKWTDKQWEFNDRWFKAIKKVDDYWTRGIYPIFNEDGSVILGTRQHIFMTHGESDGYRPTKTFPNWKKVKFSEMIDFVKYAVKTTPKKVKDAKEANIS